MSSLFSNHGKRELNSITDKCLDIIYFGMLFLEALLALRWIWLASGTHSNSLVSSLISKISAPFAAPFSIFFKIVEVNENSYVFDFHPLVLMFFYGLMGLLLGQILRVCLGDKRP